MSVNAELKQIYDKNPGYYAGARTDILPFVPPNAKSILDVGCGEGNFGALLKAQGNRRVWGTDIDEDSIGQAKLKLDHAIAGNISEQLSLLEDRFFDTIFFNDVLEHLIDPYTLLSKIKTKLTPSGQVIACIPNVRYFRVLNKLLLRRDFEYDESGVMDKTHLRFFTYKSMVRLFQEAGYKVESIAPVNKTKSIKPLLWKICTLGLIGNDIQYMQYVITAKAV